MVCGAPIDEYLSAQMYIGRCLYGVVVVGRWLTLEVSQDRLRQTA